MTDNDKPIISKEEAETPNLGGRPTIKFTEEQMQKMQGLLEEQCTDEEIAAELKVHRTSVTNHKKSDPVFLENYETGKARGRASLRHIQFLSARGEPAKPLLDSFGQPVFDTRGKPVLYGGREPNVIMQIFLGKNALGQSDRQEMTGKDGGPMIVEVRYDG